MKAKELRKKILAIAVSAVVAVTMTACSSGEKRKDANSIKQENQATSSNDNKNTNVASTKKTEYPLTIKTYENDGSEITTTYKEAPKKVLAVYQGSIETMLSLGLSDHLVATAGLDNEVLDDQKAAFSKVKYLDKFTPNKESVTMLQPDMILSWGSLFSEKNLGTSKAWIDKNVNTYINSNTRAKYNGVSQPRTLENEYTDILNLGKIFDVQDKAESIVSDMKSVIDTTKEKAKDVSKKPTALILESSSKGFTNYGTNSLGGDMLTKLGGTLLNSDKSSLGKEDIISANPDVIFVVYMPYSGDDAKKVQEEKLNVILNDKSLASLDAVKNKRIVPIKLSEMYASATRTNDGIKTIAKGLYPSLNLDN